MVSQFTNDPFEQAKAFGEYQQKLDNQHLALGAAAMAPGVGMGPALLDAKLYYQEGHPVDAAISAASALPLAGTGVGLAKGAMAAPLLAGMVKYERIEDFISAGYRYSGQALTKLKELGYSLKETAYLDVAAHAGGSRQNAATISQLVDKAGNAVGKPHTFNDEIFFDPHDKADKGARAWALLEDLNLFK